MAPQSNEGRSIGHGLGPLDSGFKGIEVVGDFADLVDVPSVGPEPHASIIGERQLRGTVDGDVVIVVNKNEPTKAEMTGERRRFVAHALHEVAVTDDGERVVRACIVAKTSAKVGLGDGHSNSISHPLPQWPGGYFDAHGMAPLGVTRGL